MPSYSVHTIINDTPFSVISNLNAAEAYSLAIRPEMSGQGWVVMLKIPALDALAKLKETHFVCIAHTIESNNPNDYNEQILIVRQPEQ